MIIKPERISSVDALRGFSLLGIIIANLPYDTSALTGESNQVSNMIFHLLIDKKFITIFSILFGFGFFVQMRSAKINDYNFKKYFLIRMALLFFIGCLHAYLLWFGDIVRSFAVGGLFLLLIYKLNTKKLLLLAFAFNIIFTGIIFIGNGALGWQKYSYDYSLPEKLPVTESYLEYLKINFTIDPWMNFPQDMPVTLAFTIGNILLGFILGKIDFFAKPEKFKRLTNWIIPLGIILGITASYIYYHVVKGNIEMDISMAWLPFVLIAGMVLQSLFYISAFIRLYQSRWFWKIFSIFEPVGKTALTNYILQSVYYILFFFHSVGIAKLFGKVNLMETYLIGIGLFLVQILLSKWWLNSHKQGPVEKIWKKLSYKFGLSK